MSSLENILGKYAADIDNTIKTMLAQAPEPIHGIISYHFGWVDQNFRPGQFERGKMFRPTMSLLAFESINGEHQGALPIAAAIEMIHNFSLIHDDIEDEDRERRGRATAWTIWGKPRAINTGDFLYSLAFKTLYQLDPDRFPPERIFAVLNTIIDACLKLTEGQELDLSFETLADVSTDMYLDMVYKKTGALIEAAIVSGAQLATSETAILQNYYQFARNIGAAFQIRDDILGIWGDTAQTGKSTTSDLRRKKKTFPVIYMLAQADDRRKEKLIASYAKSAPLSDEEIEFVRDSLEQTNSYDYAKNIAADYREKAFQALHNLNISNQARLELETLAKFLVDRSY